MKTAKLILADVHGTRHTQTLRAMYRGECVAERTENGIGLGDYAAMASVLHALGFTHYTVQCDTPRPLYRIEADAPRRIADLGNAWYFVEFTDTFGGEANYSWVRRFRVWAPNAKLALTMAKQEAFNGWDKVPRHVVRYGAGDDMRVDLVGLNQCAFVQYFDGQAPVNEIRALNRPLLDMPENVRYLIRESKRTQCGQARAEYRPDWSIAHPWAIYWHGDAVAYVATLGDAAAWFKSKGMTL